MFYGYVLSDQIALDIRSLDPDTSKKIMKNSLGKEFNFEDARDKRRELMRQHIECNGLESKPGLSEIIDYLQSINMKFAIATSTNLPRVIEYLKQINMHEKFDHIICTSMVPRGKPAPDVYIYACEKIGEKPIDCLAVEDAPNGIKSAYNAGCKVMMIPDLSQPDSELEKMIYAVGTTLNDVITIIESEK